MLGHFVHPHKTVLSRVEVMSEEVGVRLGKMSFKVRLGIFEVGDTVNKQAS
jgi:hypothetical protein